MISAFPSDLGIVSIGAAVPERILTNEELSRRVDTSDEWIQSRTGIRERRIAGPDEWGSDLALRAAEQALDRAGIAPAAIDLVVVGSASPERFFPSTAAIVADRLGAHSAAAYDLLAACSGFAYGLAQAAGQLQAGMVEHALVIGSETLSRILDWDDRSTCILFGDGAGAVVMSRAAQAEAMLAIELGADGAHGLDLYADTLRSEDRVIRMNGREVFRFASRVMVESSARVLERAGLTIDDVDWFIPHQANKRIIDYAVERLAIDPARVLVNLDRYGNTSSASIPLCLEEAWRAGRIERGDRVLMVGFVGGLTWGSCLTTWAGAGPSIGGGIG